jgi:NAD+ synthase (glutamine-hydrolysing)
MAKVIVATCQLNQWALDFDGNMERIIESCEEAKRLGAKYRLGPELEICGYGCEDHFYEQDTIQHCWESLVEILKRGASDGLLCDFGMPVLKDGVRYNCRILCYNRTILLIRPKTDLADQGNYRESRYFTAYSSHTTTTFQLPSFVHAALAKDHGSGVFVTTTNDVSAEGNSSSSCPFGWGCVQSADGIRVGCESCEELWTPRAPHVEMALQGVHIWGNGSGSHHELRKLEQRIQLMASATQKCGGVYLYANQRGCDGSGRLYYDGSSMIVVNGQIVSQAPQFSLEDITVKVATVDIDQVISYRASIPSFGVQAASTSARPLLIIPCSNLTLGTHHSTRITQPLKKIHYSTPEEECCLGPACWLWDYLRRSGASGFLLPLSGGADSSAVAAIVGVMCRLVLEAVPNQDQVRRDLKRLLQVETQDDIELGQDWIPKSATELAHFVFHSLYMGTEYSSSVTESRALRLSNAIGSYHLTLRIDLMVKAVLTVFRNVTGQTPKFRSACKSSPTSSEIAQDLALQNIQARLRMVTAYFFAQLLPWVRGRTGFLLVLGSANVDEALRGYLTKYDCSSADLNPIGAMSKRDLNRMLLHCAKDYSVLSEIALAPPTAELRPQESSNNQEDMHKHSGSTETPMAMTTEHSQRDEDEMGMTYDELGWFGRLRKIHRCGPVSMYQMLLGIWSHLTPIRIAEKVQRFFVHYAIHRHKLCTLTPSYHAEAYSPDDNRFDLRPFLYNIRWNRQFRVMQEMALSDESNDIRESNKS